MDPPLHPRRGGGEDQLFIRFTVILPPALVLLIRDSCSAAAHDAEPRGRAGHNARGLVQQKEQLLSELKGLEVA